MGWLFGPSEETIAKVEQKVYDMFVHNPYIHDIAMTIHFASEDQLWIEHCQGYYDSRKRTVFFDKDIVSVMWYSEKMVRTSDGTSRSEKEIHGQVGYSHTKSGYCPLHEFVDNNTAMSVITIPVDKVIELFARTVKQEMEQCMPECKFGNITKIDGLTAFTYTVPELEWKDWF